ncbi:hypothetical protein CAP39_02535 [Sphingomonas sp. IBVSS1]|nr:hypothetical protein CAP39_02535 [Sphingomonas sp. IBVSS1]
MRWAPLLALALAACGPAPTPQAEETMAVAEPAVPDAPPPQPAAPRPPIRLSNAPPFAAAARDGTACTDITGRLDDPDPAGRNVRDAPSPKGNVLGIIPAQGRLDFPATFEILESRNGWLKIRNAGFDTALVGDKVPPTYTGEGWISGKGVGVVVQARLGFAAPSHDAPWLVDARPDNHLDSVQQRAIVGCAGNWVLVDWLFEAKPSYGATALAYRPQAVVSRTPITLRAWSTGICNIQETTCDGVDGDRPG